MEETIANVLITTGYKAATASRQTKTEVSVLTGDKVDIASLYNKTEANVLTEARAVLTNRYNKTGDKAATSNRPSQTTDKAGDKVDIPNLLSKTGVVTASPQTKTGDRITVTTMAAEVSTLLKTTRKAGRPITEWPGSKLPINLHIYNEQGCRKAAFFVDYRNSRPVVCVLTDNRRRP
jgi:hypothetical protein